MFTKNLYGRYQKVRENERGFYGNWELSLVFEDEMQGRVKHSITNSTLFTCPFFVGLEVEGSLLYCIEVDKDDLVYWFFLHISTLVCYNKLDSDQIIDAHFYEIILSLMMEEEDESGVNQP